MTTTRLEQIVAAHRAHAARDPRNPGELEENARRAPSPRSFRDALTIPGLSVIAEVKRRSPSAGDLDTGLDPAALAGAYGRGGAACISVLTDEEFFGGSVDDLRAVRASVEVPVLRKDFTVDRRDVLDARIMGADAVLLIVAALSDVELRELGELAVDLGLSALFEAHDEAEIDRALSAGATIVGVNQRDLHTFAIDRDLAARLRPHIPEGVVAVAESGIRDVHDAQRAADAGYDAVLVGSALVTAADGPVGAGSMVAAMTGLVGVV